VSFFFLFLSPVFGQISAFFFFFGRLCCVSRSFLNRLANGYHIMLLRNIHIYIVLPLSCYKNETNEIPSPQGADHSYTASQKTLFLANKFSRKTISDWRCPSRPFPTSDYATYILDSKSYLVQFLVHHMALAGREQDMNVTSGLVSLLGY
jgi:hypothetical protein